MRAGPVIDALEAAVAARGGDVAGVIFRSDRGSQYAVAAFTHVCDQYGTRRSMGRVGPSYDNALAESAGGSKPVQHHRRGRRTPIKRTLWHQLGLE